MSDFCDFEEAWTVQNQFAYVNRDNNCNFKVLLQREEIIKSRCSSLAAWTESLKLFLMNFVTFGRLCDLAMLQPLREPMWGLNKQQMSNADSRVPGT